MQWSLKCDDVRKEKTGNGKTEGFFTMLTPQSHEFQIDPKVVSFWFTLCFTQTKLLFFVLEELVDVADTVRAETSSHPRKGATAASVSSLPALPWGRLILSPFSKL